MIGRTSVALARDMEMLFDAGTAVGLSDGQLLERFAAGRDDPAESAFEALILRHGPMVLRVCRNALADPNDAQDAFQATFLILVKRRGAIRKLESVGSWLFGVASRVAARARVEAARRRAAERRGGLRVLATADSPAEEGHDPAEFGPAVQDEVRRLPEKYRAVVVLCYWEGCTQEQAAAQLGCPLGTVRSRLARARELLRRRLTRRGLAPVATLVAAGLDPAAASATIIPTVPNPLVSSTVKAAAHLVAGRAVSDVTTATVAALVQSVLRSMMMLKIKTVAIGLVLMGLSAWGVSLAAPQAAPRRAAPAARLEARPDPGKAQPPLHSLGDYVVEPPDMLQVEVLEALPGRPVSGERLVRPDGKISMGFYGDVYVAGLTIPEVKEKIILQLRKCVSDETLGIVEIDPDKDEPKLDAQGEPIRIKHLRDSDRVFVDVTAYNSKNYYVQGEVAVPGRLPVTGRETILDAIHFAGGLTLQANHNDVVLYRQAKGGALQKLPVNIDQIMMGDDLSTNYQLEPGDRLVVPRIRGQSSGAPRTEAERPSTVPAKQQAPSPYFDRALDAKPDRPHNELRLPASDVAEQATARRVDRDPGFGGPGLATLRRLEQRLSDVERKLDRILKVLEPKTP